MNAMHGGTAKTDPLDAHKMAALLRGGMLPQALVSPAARRATCDLLHGWVVAPSRIPKKAGERVTTERRDAVQLARLARSGALPRLYGPQVEDDAMRDLTRAREDALSDLQDARLRLNACLRRHEIGDPGTAHRLSRICPRRD
jgi:hypothetical protein